MYLMFSFFIVLSSNVIETFAFLDSFLGSIVSLAIICGFLFQVLTSKIKVKKE